VDLHTKKQSDVNDARISNSVKPFKVKKARFGAPAELPCDRRHDPFENKVSEKCCSIQCVKKKKHKNKRCQSAAAVDDGGTCHAITLDHCSSPAVMTPGVRFKSAAKCVKNAERSLKSGCSDSTGNSSSSNRVCESLSLDSSVPRKRKKRKRYCADVDSTVKLKKGQAVDSKSAEVHAAADKCSVGPVKCNFNVIQLRSALQQRGRLSDAVLQKDQLPDNTKAVQIDQKVATASTKCDQVGTNISEANDSSLPSETEKTGSSSDVLKKRLMKRLTSARFRFVNEQMYNSTGAEAAEMFAHDKDAFNIYHAGFQSQVSKWPTNPVDRMIDYINSR